MARSSDYGEHMSRMIRRCYCRAGWLCVIVSIVSVWCWSNHMSFRFVQNKVQGDRLVHAKFFKKPLALNLRNVGTAEICGSNIFFRVPLAPPGIFVLIFFRLSDFFPDSMFWTSQSADHFSEKLLIYLHQTRKSISFGHRNSFSTRNFDFLIQSPWPPILFMHTR